MRITHIGGPTTLIEIDGWRILTDPTFDPPGRRYAFGWGTSSRKLVGPAVAVDALGTVDAVLLTHDQHGDNLDEAGRAMLPSAGTVLTTASAAARLDGNAYGSVRGLAPWSSVRLERPGRVTIEVTATPARHGPPLSRPIVGDVVGFALRWDGQRDGALWITGDTVWYQGLRAVAARQRIGIVLLHLGGVRFPVTGPVRYTMTPRDAVDLCRLVRPRTVIPIHFEGWEHFQHSRAAIEAEFNRAPDDIRRSIRWLPFGTPTDLDA